MPSFIKQKMPSSSTSFLSNKPGTELSMDWGFIGFLSRSFQKIYSLNVENSHQLFSLSKCSLLHQLH
jgi:hypothetical protein